MDAPLADAGADRIAAIATGRRIALVTDATVAPLHARPLARRLGLGDDAVLVIPPGEGAKTRETWGRVTDEMLARGYGRDSIVVAVGGGVVGDLAGFVAATYMRGVPVIQVPTTLLAMIDAAVGGKTGVDTPAGKNLVGAFHHPALVVADSSVLRTLPATHLRNGLAEALKHALITSSDEVEWLLAHSTLLVDPARATEPAFVDLVARNIEIKADVVRRDERESGVRKVLNFGHTIGHAIETVTGFGMLHGECVAVGMCVEALIAAHAGHAAREFPARVVAAVEALGLPTCAPLALDPNAILDATRVDKKGRRSRVEYALVARAGEMVGADRGYGTVVDDTIVLSALTELLSAAGPRPGQ